MCVAVFLFVKYLACISRVFLCLSVQFLFNFAFAFCPSAHVMSSEPSPQATATQTKPQNTRHCLQCSNPFDLKSDPNQQYCNRSCYRKRGPKQQATPFSQPSGGKKRPQDTRTPPTSPTSDLNSSTKKGKLDNITTFLSDPSLQNLDSLGNHDLVSLLKTSLSYLRDFETISLQHKSAVEDLESTVIRLKAEITDIKVAFADKALSSLVSSRTPTYASVLRESASSVLVASFADGEKPGEPLNVSSVEKLLDAKTNGIVPQRVRERDNNVYITFNDSADVAKASSLFQKKADCSRIFKSVSQLDIFYPVVALFVDVSDTDRLKDELEHRNPLLKNRIQSLKVVFTKPNTSIGHVKVFLRTKQSKAEILRKARVYVFDSTHRVVDIDLNREVRRCFNCQRYGHTQTSCKAQTPACGKCADKHRTRECSAESSSFKCVNCSGQHQTGHKSCVDQVKAVARYRSFLDN